MWWFYEPIIPNLTSAECHCFCVALVKEIRKIVGLHKLTLGWSQGVTAQHGLTLQLFLSHKLILYSEIDPVKV